MKLELQKLAIKKAGAATDMQAGFMATLKAGMPTSGILVAAYAVQAAAMMVAFRKSTQKSESLLGGTAGGGGMSAPVVPPSFNVLGATSNDGNMIANTIAGVNDNPVRAYVLEGDVTSAQSAARNTSDLASVG